MEVTSLSLFDLMPLGVRTNCLFTSIFMTTFGQFVFM